MEKPRGYPGEYFPRELQGQGQGLGTSRETIFTRIPSRLFHLLPFFCNPALVQGGPLFLPHPQKTESQTWRGNGPRTPPHVWDSVFLGGGKNSSPPCTWDSLAANIAPREYPGVYTPLAFYNIDSVNSNILGRDLERMYPY